MSQAHPQSSVYLHKSIIYTPLVAAVLGAGYYAYKYSAQDIEDDDESSQPEQTKAPRHNRGKRLVGLHNLGNTCYMNSLI